MARKLSLELIFATALLLLPLCPVFAEEAEKVQTTQEVQKQDISTIDSIIGIPVIGGFGACIVAYNNKRKKKTKNRPTKTIEANKDQQNELQL